MKESFRVYLVRHDDGRMTGHLMPRWSSLLSPLPPSAYGDDEDGVLFLARRASKRSAAFLSPGRSSSARW